MNLNKSAIATQFFNNSAILALHNSEQRKELVKAFLNAKTTKNAAFWNEFAQNLLENKSKKDLFYFSNSVKFYSFFFLIFLFSNLIYAFTKVKNSL